MITIFTPTYNREKNLHKLYESLNNQTIFEFEWIVIDDMSNDETEKVVCDWQKENKKFKITYQKVPHGGKHRAINKAVQLAQYEWFFIVDSDDYISNDAVEKIISWIKKVDLSSKIAGVVGSRYEIRRKQALSIPSILILNPGLRCYNHERSFYGLECDKAEVYRTDILKKFPFPEYDNEYFVTEAVVWDKISYAGYSLLFYPDIIYYCEYQEDGLTRNGANGYDNFLINMHGFFDYVKIEVKCHGISNETKPLIKMGLLIAEKRKVSYKLFSQYTDISLELVNQMLKELKKEKNIFIRVIKHIARSFL